LDALADDKPGNSHRLHAIGLLRTDDQPGRLRDGAVGPRFMSEFSRRSRHAVAEPLRLVPRAPRPAPVANVCHRPACPNTVPPSEGRGRPSLYCSAVCRRLFTMEQRQVRAALRDHVRIAKQYDIEVHVSTSGSEGVLGGSGESAAQILAGVVSELERLARTRPDDEALGRAVRDVKSQLADLLASEVLAR